MHKKFPPPVQKYFDNRLLVLIKERKDEEKRLGRSLTLEDDMRLAMRGCIKKAALMEELK